MNKISSQKFICFIKSYLIVSVAGALNAISLYSFVNPVNLIAGGFSGLSSAVCHVLSAIWSVDFDDLMPIIYLILNTPLLICSLIFLRGDFTFKTIWATLVSTLVLKIIPDYLKFSESPLISVIFGGIIIGFSMFIASEQNGSNGGTEIIGRIVNKYHPEIDMSKVVLLCNFVISLFGSVITIMYEETAKPDIIPYSFLYIIIGGNILGLFKRGFNHPQKFLIITTEYECIGETIQAHFGRGYTCLDIDNSYDGKKRKMISVIVQYRQMPSLKKIIRTIDPDAFTVIKDVDNVFSRPEFNRSYKLK